MQFKKIHLLLLSVLTFSACQVENNATIDDNAIGNSLSEFSVSSDLDNGFSFEKMSVTVDSVNQNTNSDFIVFQQLGSKGEAQSPFLVQPYLKSSYVLLKQFSNAYDAKVFYDNYNTYSVTGLVFKNTAVPVEPHQIWLVKTNKNQYGKLLITETNFSSTANEPNATVTFKAELLN